MNTFHATQKVGEIVSILPKAGEIFKKYRIDFCCGGHRPLGEVIKEQELDEQEVIQMLEEAYEEARQLAGQTDFREMAFGDLIDYIVGTHHVYLKKTLPELSDLTTTILRVHGSKHTGLFKVHKLFHNLKMELDQHLIKEEEILFPLIKEYEGEPSEPLLKKIEAVAKETEEEHEAAGDILKELRKITDDYIAPDDGCDTYRKTFKTLQELEGDLFQHIHLENNILFRRLGLSIR